MIRNKKNVPYIRVLKRTDTYILISGENKKKNKKKPHCVQKIVLHLLSLRY